MPKAEQYQSLYDRIAALRAETISRLSADLNENPQLADEIGKQIDEMLRVVVDSQMAEVPPNDKGLAELVGIGDEAASQLSQTYMPVGVSVYDETAKSERILAVADLYYIYQHEKIGVFRVVKKLQELFRGGTARLSSGPGAFHLYQFDRREVLRYTQRDRLAAYRRAFGYGSAPVPAGSHPNTDFHRLFTQFIDHVSRFWRDKRISDIIRERNYDPSFGSIAVVRRAGLDLRNNVKYTSYGNLNVLRVEVMQLLDEAFRILDADDVKRLFGAETAWDVVEDVVVNHFHEPLATSPRQRMAVTGREVLRWLAQPHVLQSERAQFEALLRDIAEDAEEWLTSAQSVGVVAQPRSARALPAPPRNGTARAQRNGQPAEKRRQAEYEW